MEFYNTELRYILDWLLGNWQVGKMTSRVYVVAPTHEAQHVGKEKEKRGKKKKEVL